MTPERRQEIARMGGASIPSAKRSFSLNRDLAVSAGRAGGQAKSTPVTQESKTEDRAQKLDGPKRPAPLPEQTDSNNTR